MIEHLSQAGGQHTLQETVASDRRQHPPRSSGLAQFLAQVMREQLVDDPLQWMAISEHFHRTVRADDAQSSRLAAPRDKGEEFQRRGITPMQVFQLQDQGCSAVSASRASAISRSIRSRVAPCVLRCSAS